MRVALLLLVLLSFAPAVAAAGDCTVLADAATGRLLRQDGDCDERVSPASTFKIALAVMGYDAGILIDAKTPVRPYREEYGAWVESWKTDVDPTTWLRNSVVWYSWGITRALGAARFQDYVDAFGYGNRDLTGNPGKADGLTHAWLSASLRISPLEQVAFLRRLVRGELPASPESQRRAMEIVPGVTLAGGWTARGKTGTGLRQAPDGSRLQGRQLGWFVGWATKGDRTLLFARLERDEAKAATNAGFRARDALVADWPALVGASP